MRSTVCRRASSGPKMRTRTSCSRPPHGAFGERGVEQLGVVGAAHRRGVSRLARSRRTPRPDFIACHRCRALRPRRDGASAISANGLRSSSSVFQRRKRRLQAARPAHRPHRVSASLMRRREVAAMQRLARCLRNARRAPGRRPGAAALRARAAQDRALQHADRKGVDAGQRMLQQREQRHRREPAERRLGHQPREHAGRRVGERSPPESSTGTFQRASAASTRRASARSGVTSAAVLPGVSTASRSATAIASASSSALAASITAASASAASACAVKSGVAEPLLPKLGRGGRPQRLGHKPLAAVRRRRRQRHHGVARDADPAQQRVHGELRMAVRRPSSLPSPPISSHDAASRSVSRPGSTTAPCGSWRWWPAAPRSPASSRSSRPRSPARCSWRGARPPRRSACRGAPPARWRSARRGSAASARARTSGIAASPANIDRPPRGPASSSLSQGTCRVVMSSISRARLPASMNAAAGLLATSGAPPRAVHLSASAPISGSARRAARCARSRRARPEGRARRRKIGAGGLGEFDLVRVDVVRCATMRGRTAASLPSVARNMPRASRQARRVGR